MVRPSPDWVNSRFVLAGSVLRSWYRLYPVNGDETNRPVREEVVVACRFLPGAEDGP